MAGEFDDIINDVLDKTVQMSEKGNIDLTNRPRVRNPDGSLSTVASANYDYGGTEVLLPMVGDEGRMLTDAEVKKRYERTGKHLGKFPDDKNAEKYAKRLHEQQEQLYGR